MNVVTSVETPYDQAVRATKEKRLEDAADLLVRVLTDEPHHIRALDLLGFVRFGLDQFAAAEDCCRRAIAIDPQHAYAYKGLGLSLARQGKTEEGIAALRKAIELKPLWADPCWDLAVVLFEAERFAESLEWLSRGELCDPRRGSQFAAFADKVKKRIKNR